MTVPHQAVAGPLLQEAPLGTELALVGPLLQEAPPRTEQRRRRVLTVACLVVAFGGVAHLSLTYTRLSSRGEAHVEPAMIMTGDSDNAAVNVTPQAQNHSGHDLRHSVVKIFNTEQEANWRVPWQKKEVESTSGSGAVIKVPGTQPELVAILTAAHVVSDSRYLQIQRSSDRFSSEKFPARVIAVCHEIDLALMEVADPKALADIHPLELAPNISLPRISDKVRVVGYPVGGMTCSITEGVVSRVEVQEYAHSLRRSLCLTVDAAINSGNSGGPVIDTRTAQVLGVAIQKMVATGVELQGHAVPAPLVWRFITESVPHLSPDKTYRMLMPWLGYSLHNLDSPVFRRSLGLPQNKTGMFMSFIHGGAPEGIRELDVLLEFDGHSLDNRGFCQVLGQRLQFFAARDLRAVGQQVSLTVWRDGHEEVIHHTLPPSQDLVPRCQYDVDPSYFICGGFVFQPLSHEYMDSIGDPAHLVNMKWQGCKTNETERVVLITTVLEDAINEGYGSGYIGAPVIKKMNGKPVRDLDHLVKLVQDARSNSTVPFLTFEGEGVQGRRIVLPTDGLAEADQRITQKYGSPTYSYHFDEFFTKQAP